MPTLVGSSTFTSVAIAGWHPTAGGKRPTLLPCNVLQVSTLAEAYRFILQCKQSTWQMVEEHIVHLNPCEIHVIRALVISLACCCWDLHQLSVVCSSLQRKLPACLFCSLQIKGHPHGAQPLLANFKLQAAPCVSSTDGSFIAGELWCTWMHDMLLSQPCLDDGIPVF